MKFKWFVWGLPEFIHSIIKLFTGHIIVAEIDTETFEPVDFHWEKWNDYAWRTFLEHMKKTTK